MPATCTGRASGALSWSTKPFGVRRPTAVRVPARVVAARYKVEIEHAGKTHTIEVPAGETVLEVALSKGLDLPHDCKLGVCMTCPAKMISGKVDQSGSMLSDDVAQKGYALLCVAQPTTDCKIATVSEDELLDQQFGN